MKNSYRLVEAPAPLVRKKPSPPEIRRKSIEIVRLLKTAGDVPSSHCQQAIKALIDMMEDMERLEASLKIAQGCLGFYAAGGIHADGGRRARDAIRQIYQKHEGS